jgi:hypothetical protein
LRGGLGFGASILFELRKSVAPHFNRKWHFGSEAFNPCGVDRSGWASTVINENKEYSKIAPLRFR